MLEFILLDTLANVPVDSLDKLPDELLRRVFARLPEATQTMLHGRLFTE